MENSTEKKYNVWITILSIAIPLVVALLFKVKLKDFGVRCKTIVFLATYLCNN